jgi:hypothetical protein
MKRKKEMSNKERKIPSWFEEMHEELARVLHKYSLLYCLSPRDLLPFLSATITGQFAISDYSEEFVKQALDRIFDKFKEKRKQMKDMGAKVEKEFKQTCITMMLSQRNLSKDE